MDQAEYIFTRILRAEVEDQDRGGEAMAESFRADDLYGMIDEVIEEMSFMSHGAVAPSHFQLEPFEAQDSRGPRRTLMQRKKTKKKEDKKKKVIPEGMVEQVLNYLLNKEAPL